MESNAILVSTFPIAAISSYPSEHSILVSITFILDTPNYSQDCSIFYYKAAWTIIICNLRTTAQENGCK
jgi:hypothetical protein